MRKAILAKAGLGLAGVVAIALGQLASCARSQLATVTPAANPVTAISAQPEKEPDAAQEKKPDTARKKSRKVRPGPVAGPIEPPPPGKIAPEANLKVAFIGDTGAGPDFESVLKVIAVEGAAATVHMGDATYRDETSDAFWSAVDKTLGHEYPYFLSQGNHDRPQWQPLAAHGAAHMNATGVKILDSTHVEDPIVHFTFKGLSVVFLGQQVREEDPSYILQRFADDEHIWKLCGWHKNQGAMQVGGKRDDMGWGVYESCREMGAVIMTGHEHSYERTKTLVNTIEQVVDPECSDPKKLCVRPGAVPVFVSGLGGKSIRDQKRCLPADFPYGCNGEWAFIYTSHQNARFGALFVVFNEGGDPRKARGYFKNIDGQVIDEFVMTAEGPTPIANQ